MGERGSNPQAGRLLPRDKGHAHKQGGAPGTRATVYFWIFIWIWRSLWRTLDYISTLSAHKIPLICPTTGKGTEKLSEQCYKAADRDEPRGI
jgi:hypothetical protein